MNAVLLATPEATTASGIPLALLLAASVTALVSVTLFIVLLRRTAHRSRIAAGFSAVGAAAILASALLVGGALASPAAVADAAPATPRGASGPYSEVQLDGIQLPTLFLDGSSNN